MVREKGQDASAMREVSFEFCETCFLGASIGTKLLVRGDVKRDFEVNIPAGRKEILQVKRQQGDRRDHLIASTHNEVDDCDWFSGQCRTGSSLKPAGQLEETLQGRFPSQFRQAPFVEPLVVISIALLNRKN